MATELRWILAALCVPLLLGIWWWGARRSRHAPGDPDLRDSSNSMSARHPDETPVLAARDWGVSPLEPLSVHRNAYEDVPILDMPITSRADSFEETLDLDLQIDSDETAIIPGAVQPAGGAAVDLTTAQDIEEASATAATVVAPAVTVPPPVTPPADATVPPVVSVPPVVAAPPAVAPAPPVAGDPGATGQYRQSPNATETQHILSLRISAAAESGWPGSELMTALENRGLAFGRYQVFHRRHSDGRTLFCAASLVEPGTFNLSRMPMETFRGLTLFAVLPGPVEPLQTFDALLQAAGELSDALRGTVQDSSGAPLTWQRAEALREEVARFQALLTMT